MKKEDFLKLGLTEEQATKAAEASAEELKGFIPKDRFDQVNDSKKKLEKDLVERDKQLEDLKKVDAEALKAEIEKLQGENKAAQEKHQAEMKQVQLNAALDKALTGAKAKNIKAVKALLDLEKVDLDDDGETIKGLDDQLKSLQEDEGSSFLFEATKPADPPPNKFKGIKPGDPKPGAPGDPKPATLADALRAKFNQTEAE